MRDGVFSFWTAYYGSWRLDARVVFRVREDTTPTQRAAEKQILWYDRLLPATTGEIASWYEGHRQYWDNPNVEYWDD